MKLTAGVLALLLGLAGNALCQDEPEAPVPEPRVEESPVWEEDGAALLDFSSMEVAARVGMASFSEDFEADPEMVYGLFLRVPSPWVSRDIFGFGEDDIGFWVEGVVSEIERDEDLQLETPDDTIFFVGAGIDYEIIWDRQEGWSWYLRAMAGGQYGNFGDVDDLHDGAAATVGVLLGLEVSGITLTVTPQAAFAEAGDWIGFGHAGLGLRF